MDINTITPFVAVYIRTSTTNQNHESQIDECVRYIKSKYGESVEFKVYIEKKSARNPKRLRKLNNIIKCTGDGILVLFHSVDRFSRNVKEGLELLDLIIDKGGSWHFVKESISSEEYVKDPIKKQMVVMALSNAELESKLIGQRVSRTIQFRKNNNIPMGPLYGIRLCYDKSGCQPKIVKIPDEIKVIDEIKQEIVRFDLKHFRLNNKNLSIFNSKLVNHIVKYLNNIGLKYRNGKDFTRRHVINIIKLIKLGLV